MISTNRNDIFYVSAGGLLILDNLFSKRATPLLSLDPVHCILGGYGNTPTLSLCCVSYTIQQLADMILQET